MPRELWVTRHSLTVNELWDVVKHCYRTLILKAIAVKTNGTLNVMITGYLTHADPEFVRKLTEQVSIPHNFIIHCMR